MKTVKIFTLLALTVTAFVTACKKDNPDPVDGDEQTDHSNLGVYKGVLVGSTGYFTVTLKETGSTAEVVFDGESHSLQSAETLNEGADVVDFELNSGDDVSLQISVGADGSNPEVTVSIPDHDVEATVYKETTEKAVELYIGENESSQTWAGTTYTLRSTLNISINGDAFTLLEKETYSSYRETLDLLVYRYAGSVSRTPSTITFHLKQANDGGDTPLEDLNPEDQDELVFTIDGDKLTWRDEGDDYVDVIELTRQ